MVKGIVVTHGRFAEELLLTAGRIFGDFSDCHAVTNVNKSPQALTDELAGLIPNPAKGGCILFVDFFGGSCSYACFKLLGSFSNIQVISGINLPMFLAFLNKRDEIGLNDLPGEIVERGKDSIQILTRESL
jgi:mannose/fructose-specific phosphotransferase system component IIA